MKKKSLLLNGDQAMDLEIYLNGVKHDIQEMRDILKSSGALVHSSEVERVIADMEYSLNDIQERIKFE